MRNFHVHALSDRSLEGFCQKRGKRQWATRFLQVYGKRVFVFREKVKEEEAYPLNILDTRNMLIEWDGDCLVKIVTRREVQTTRDNHM